MSRIIVLLVNIKGNHGEELRGEGIIVKENINYIEFHEHNHADGMSPYAYVHFKEGLRIRVTKEQYEKIKTEMYASWRE